MRPLDADGNVVIMSDAIRTLSELLLKRAYFMPTPDGGRVVNINADPAPTENAIEQIEANIIRDMGWGHLLEPVQDVDIEAIARKVGEQWSEIMTKNVLMRMLPAIVDESYGFYNDDPDFKEESFRSKHEHHMNKIVESVLERHPKWKHEIREGFDQSWSRRNEIRMRAVLAIWGPEAEWFEKGSNVSAKRSKRARKLLAQLTSEFSSEYGFDGSVALPIASQKFFYEKVLDHCTTLDDLRLTLTTAEHGKQNPNDLWRFALGRQHHLARALVQEVQANGNTVSPTLDHAASDGSWSAVPDQAMMEMRQLIDFGASLAGVHRSASRETTERS